MEAIEANGALREVSLRTTRPRSERVWIGVRDGRISSEVVPSDHLKAVGEGLHRLLLAIVGNTGVHEVIAWTVSLSILNGERSERLTICAGASPERALRHHRLLQNT